MVKQVKSRKRVQEHGEVFTNELEVNAMLDMVKQETERIDSRFLEPACGDGNALSPKAVDWEFDEETQSFIPLPIREFPLTSIYKVMKSD